MKKRKTYEVSVINKTYSKTYSDQAKFYTSDTSLELNFQLKEVEYDFDSADIILLNVDDRSLVTRPVAKSADGFTYELEDDIVEHYGEWKGQLKFNEGGEIYVSSPVSFRIENDLNNDRPPQLTEVNTWKNLRTIADGLIADIRSELELVAVKVSEIDGAESERQSAEFIRVNNENQRNLTSVDEFVKLQNAIGGRNLLRGTANFDTPLWRNVTTAIPSTLDSRYKQVRVDGDFTVAPITTMSVQGWNFEIGEEYIISVWAKSEVLGNKLGVTSQSTPYVEPQVVTVSKWSRYVWMFTATMSNLTNFRFETRDGERIWITKPQIEKGTILTDWTLAPEDYKIVSKDDYYNHIKLVNNAKDNEFNQLKQAVIALGGTI